MILICVAPNLSCFSIIEHISLELLAIVPKNQQWPSFIVSGVPVGKISGPSISSLSIKDFRGKINSLGAPKSLMVVTPE